jgi:hypothetical protein
MRIVEQGVHTPRIRLETTIHVFVPRDFRKVTIMFCLHVLYVFGMFSFHIGHPCGTDNG